VLQLLHAEGIRSGAQYDWAHYFDPPQELMDEFEDSPANLTDWKIIEPNYS